MVKVQNGKAEAAVDAPNAIFIKAIGLKVGGQASLQPISSSGRARVLRFQDRFGWMPR